MKTTVTLWGGRKRKKRERLCIEAVFDIEPASGELSVTAEEGTEFKLENGILTVTITQLKTTI